MKKKVDQILIGEVRKLNAIWELTCRGYKKPGSLKAAWKEVPTVMSGIMLRIFQKHPPGAAYLKRCPENL